MERSRTRTRGHTHSSHESSCWGGQPFPLACYSADQGQAGDQIKVLVWGELGPGAREAAWGHVGEHIRPQPRWRTCGLVLLQDKVRKRSCTRSKSQGSEAPVCLLENVKAGGSFNWNKTFGYHMVTTCHVLYAKQEPSFLKGKRVFFYDQIKLSLNFFFSEKLNKRIASWNFLLLNMISYQDYTN